MDFIKQTLMEDETIKAKAELSSIAKNIATVFMIISAILVFILYAIAGKLSFIFSPILIIAVCMYISVSSYLNATELIVTDQRIIGRTGNTTVDFSLEQITSIQVQHDIFSKFCDIGTILIETSGKTTFKIMYVMSPENLKKTIFEENKNKK